ncbi:serine protease [Streptococcus didelphis]|uniref:Serine protease n=1 Tax=Streptococcus didelphis TaxID=102886 RepID=A0ABY9LG31_9STRE|nr:serine protease [Streptococcus didelphis]WMB27824.1 serine protease [Streptococcus didelphis]WMB29713.1 serine protease [Streptococcus didelphis]
MRKTITLILVGASLSLLLLNTVQAQEEGTSTLITDTQIDPKSKTAARYVPTYSNYCSAVMITSKVGLTARHCVGNQNKEGYIGAVYPGQSGLQTPFGMMNISSYIPDNAEDIAVIKGTDSDMSSDYRKYLKDITTDISSFSLEDLKMLKGKRVYSYGYPDRSLTGYKQYKSRGIITNYNPITRQISANMPSRPGQSGSGVFLEEGDKFLGVLQGQSKNESIVTPIDKRLADWINKNK